MDYNCNDIDKISKMVEKLKEDFLFSFDDAGIAPIAEQHYLIGIDNLSQAVRSFKLSHLHQIKKE